jgi:transposase-like protein
VNRRVSYRPQELSKRLGEKKVAELVRRVEAAESVRSLARELGVANSALTRMLRAQDTTITKRKVSDAAARQMAKEYEAGATMRELEMTFGLSHGGVHRALHRVGIEPRAQAPRTS